MIRSMFRFAAFASSLTLFVSCGDDEEFDLSVLSRAEATARDQAVSAGFTGTLTANANVSVSRDGQTWFDLGSPNGITIQLQSAASGTTVHGEVDVPAATYTQARLTLRNAQATIRAGSTVNGVALASDVILAVGGSDREVVIQKQVTVSASNGRAAFVFDLNSRSWVTTQNIQDRIVDDAEVQQASAVSVH